MEQSKGSLKNDTTSPTLFDYIVVGAGPAGIITAVNLARRLEKESLRMRSEGKQVFESNVLLLESGTLSQASVLRELEKRNNGSINFKKEQLQLDAQSILLVDSDLSHLNKFDVPFLWNKLSKGNGAYLSSLYSLHHWPIDQTYLGRAVGGSGVHNAM